jgi:hypothetical protein
MSAFTLVYTRASKIPCLSDDVDIPFPNIVKAGNATNTLAFRLKDSSANFSGIQVGDIVVKLSAIVESAYVVGIENNETLILSKDIVVTGDTYNIYQGQNYGCYLHVNDYDELTASLVLQVETIGGDVVIFDQPPPGVLPVQVRKLMSGSDFNKITQITALW